jgi:N-acetylglucosamine kinase-like BadF-type ATPase
MSLVLGVYGDNTKTLALVASRNGRIVGTAVPPAAIAAGGRSPAAAIAEIEHAVEAARIVRETVRA